MIVQMSGPSLSLPPAANRDEPPVHVLVVDDDETLRRLVVRILSDRGYRVDSAADGPSALELVLTHDPDVALVDVRMPGMTGLELLPRLKALRPSLEVVVMTAFGDIGVAVDAVHAGAYQFVTKPFSANEAVALTIEKAAQHRRLADRARLLEKRLATADRFGEIIGNAPKMQAVFRMITDVAPTTSTVLVLGESGTGKELVARAIHDRSLRAAKPFVAVNCGAIPPEMAESELFGHVRGAFTGAHAPRAGLFESADGGTLFLDEIGDLPLAAQVKLLRALQSGEVKRVGSDETRTFDVRVLAATNVDLTARLDAGTFRRDLYYRLDVFAIPLPPLRERGDDVVLLARYFAHAIAQRIGKRERPLSRDAVEALVAHRWPGNVRELENAMERACIVARGDEIHAADFPFAPSRVGEEHAVARAPVAIDAAILDLPYVEARKRILEQFEDEYVRATLTRANGNSSEAARRAGLDRSNFRRVLKRMKP
jgi:two-component system response regulator HydG